MPITVFCHPFCAGQVRLERTFCAVMLKLWIDVQDNLRHLAPVCPLSVRIEHAQISNDMLLIVDREEGIRWCNIGNVRISGWSFHVRATERMLLTFHKTK